MRSSRLAAFFTSLSFFVIAALVAGVVVGAMAQGADAPWLTGGLGVVESLGQVWLNALRMTVIPAWIIRSEPAGDNSDSPGPALHRPSLSRSSNR